MDGGITYPSPISTMTDHIYNLLTNKEKHYNPEIVEIDNRMVKIPLEEEQNKESAIYYIN